MLARMVDEGEERMGWSGDGDRTSYSKNDTS